MDGLLFRWSGRFKPMWRTLAFGGNQAGEFETTLRPIALKRYRPRRAKPLMDHGPIHILGFSGLHGGEGNTKLFRAWHGKLGDRVLLWRCPTNHFPWGSGGCCLNLVSGLQMGLEISWHKAKSLRGHGLPHCLWERTRNHGLPKSRQTAGSATNWCSPRPGFGGRCHQKQASRETS